MEKVCILGAGSWGTAQALVLHHNGFNTTIWGKPDEVALITADRKIAAICRVCPCLKKSPLHRIWLKPWKIPAWLF